MSASAVGWGREGNTFHSCRASLERLLPHVRRAILHPEVDSLRHAEEQARVHYTWDHFDSCVHFTPFVDPVKLPVQDKIPITVSPLHTNLQVVNFQRCERAFTGPITQISSCVWCTLSHAFILCKLLCFRVLYCTVLLLCNIRSLQMKTWWNWRPRERTETRGRSN